MLCDNIDSFLFTRLFGPQQLGGFLGSDKVRDVSETSCLDEFLWGEIGNELPEGFLLVLGVEVPYGIRDGGGGEVDDTLFRP